MLPADLAAPPVAGSAAIYSLAAAGLATLGAVASAWITGRRGSKEADELGRLADRLEALDTRLSRAVERLEERLEEELEDRPAPRPRRGDRGPVRGVHPPQSQ